MTIFMIICALIGGAALGWIAAAAWYSRKLKWQEREHALDMTNRFYGDYEDDDQLDETRLALDERQQEIYEKMFGKPE